MQKLIQLGENLDRHACYSWLYNKLWIKEKFTSYDMEYGIDDEPNAILAYSNMTKVSVRKIGLWVNKKYAHLDTSPDS